VDAVGVQNVNKKKREREKPNPSEQIMMSSSRLEICHLAMIDTPGVPEEQKPNSRKD